MFENTATVKSTKEKIYKFLLEKTEDLEGFVEETKERPKKVVVVGVVEVVEEVEEEEEEVAPAPPAYTRTGGWRGGRRRWSGCPT